MGSAVGVGTLFRNNATSQARPKCNMHGDKAIKEVRLSIYSSLDTCWSLYVDKVQKESGRAFDQLILRTTRLAIIAAAQAVLLPHPLQVLLFLVLLRSQ